jgi:two-component system chemotaxis response regulator CheB
VFVEHGIVVIGGSAGSLSPLKTLLQQLPKNLPAAIFVVTHLAPDRTSNLAQVLSWAGSLPIIQVLSPEKIVPGTCYVAVPDYHMVISDSRVSPWRGPKEDRHRPAVNALFRSAAAAYGPRVVGVVLSGMLSDGSAGLWWIKQYGGVAVVQNPETAEFSGMPNSVLEYVDVDHVVEPKDLAPLLVKLADATGRPAVEHAQMEKKESVDLRCPDCGGPLSRIKYGRALEYRCLVGHTFSPAGMLKAHSDAEENVLWSSVAILEESVRLIGQVASQLPPEEAKRLESLAEKRIALAARARKLVENLDRLHVSGGEG